MIKKEYKELLKKEYGDKFDNGDVFYIIKVEDIPISYFSELDILEKFIDDNEETNKKVLNKVRNSSKKELEDFVLGTLSVSNVNAETTKIVGRRVCRVFMPCTFEKSKSNDVSSEILLKRKILRKIGNKNVKKYPLSDEINSKLPFFKREHYFYLFRKEF